MDYSKPLGDIIRPDFHEPLRWNPQLIKEDLLPVIVILVHFSVILKVAFCTHTSLPSSAFLIICPIMITAL